MSVKEVSESVQVSVSATVSMQVDVSVKASVGMHHLMEVDVSVEASVWAWVDTMFVYVGPSC